MAAGIRFDADAIRELAKILRETDLSEIELVEKDARLRVVRQVSAVAATHVVAAPVAAAPVAAAATVVEAALDADHPGVVTSPMVGVAYLAPEPGAAPFIQTGTRVVVGQTLLLIEAMKTYNQIKAPKAGTVSRILVNSGSPVEYGEVLMLLDP